MLIRFLTKIAQGQRLMVTELWPKKFTFPAITWPLFFVDGKLYRVPCKHTRGNAKNTLNPVLKN